MNTGGSFDYLRGLLRSWWLVVLVTAAGAAGGYAVYHRATPIYQSSTRLVVGLAKSGADEVSAQALSGAQAHSLAQIASTTPAIAAAARAAGHPDARPAVTAGAAASDPFVTITVTGPDAAVTTAVANAYVGTIVASKDELAGASAGQFRVRTVEAAQLPGAPISPDLRRDVGLGLAVGLVLAIMLAWLREGLDRGLRTSDELQRLTGLTVLGTVPRELPKEKLPAASHPRSARAEAYRQIRTTLVSPSLGGSGARRPLVVAVTSAAQGEGKTSVSANLAVVLCRSGRRVALVDADLRRPRVADFFDIGPRFGLTDVLSGEVALAEALTMREDGRLALLASGPIPANPSEALGSEAMDKVLQELAGEFEYVIVDTPPVLPVTDALVLAPKTDGLVLVVRLGQTTAARVTHALDAVHRVNATVLGLVPNQSGKGADSDYSYPYRYVRSGREPADQMSVPTSTVPVAVTPDVPIDDDSRGGQHRAHGAVDD